MVSLAKKIIVSGGISFIGLAGVYLGLFHLVPKVQKFMRTPSYSYVISSSGISSPSVTFRDRDNLAPGMRAFIEYNGKEEERPEEMLLESMEEDYAQFYIPKKAFDANDFTVWAVDRHGNKSKPKTLYTLEGIVTEKKP